MLNVTPRSELMDTTLGSPLEGGRQGPRGLAVLWERGLRSTGWTPGAGSPEDVVTPGSCG